MLDVGFQITTEEHLRRLIDNGVREGRTIDYKEGQIGGADEQKREFLCDVSSFSNASGGYLIIGVRESDGLPVEIKGLRDIEVDREILRLENLIRDGIQPRLVGVEIRPIQLAEGGVVISVKIPRSWVLPHMVVYKNLSRFYSRNSGGKQQVDVGELRGLFELSGSIAERVRSFRAERMARIIEESTPVSLENGPKIVLHAVPFGAFSSGASLDVGVFGRHNMPIPIYGGVAESRHNFDGYLTIDRIQGSTRCRSYVQVFRNGILEAVETGLIGDRGETKRIPHSALIEETSKALSGYIELLHSIGINPPIAIMFGLLDVKGYQIFVHGSGNDLRSIERDNLIFPEVVLTTLEYGDGVFMKPTWDALWNAAGWPHCWCLDEQGRFTKQ